MTFHKILVVKHLTFVIAKYFVDFQFNFWYFLKMTAKFLFLLNRFKLSKFHTFQWWKLKIQYGSYLLSDTKGSLTQESDIFYSKKSISSQITIASGSDKYLLFSRLCKHHLKEGIPPCIELNNIGL